VQFKASGGKQKKHRAKNKKITGSRKQQQRSEKKRRRKGRRGGGERKKHAIGATTWSRESGKRQVQGGASENGNWGGKGSSYLGAHRESRAARREDPV